MRVAVSHSFDSAPHSNLCKEYDRLRGAVIKKKTKISYLEGQSWFRWHKCFIYSLWVEYNLIRSSKSVKWNGSFWGCLLALHAMWTSSAGAHCSHQPVCKGPVRSRAWRQLSPCADPPCTLIVQAVFIGCSLWLCLAYPPTIIKTEDKHLVNFCWQLFRIIDATFRNLLWGGS